MEIFKTLTKYNIRQKREEGKPLLVVYNLVSILTSTAQGLFKVGLGIGS